MLRFFVHQHVSLHQIHHVSANMVGFLKWKLHVTLFDTSPITFTFKQCEVFGA